MKFAVIYELDMPAPRQNGRFLRGTEPIRWVRPYGKAWVCTEGDEQYELGYLGGVWTHGRHRKLLAVLTKEELHAFIDDMGLLAEDVETLGSLGFFACYDGSESPWLLPAVAFRGEAPYAIQSAYVTPLLEPVRAPKPTTENTERYWKMVRSALIDKYQYGA